jgi:hypothetical protein
MDLKVAAARHPIACLLALALLGLLSACSHSGSRGLAVLEGAEFRDYDPEREIGAVQDGIEEAAHVLDGHRIDGRLEETLQALLARDYATVREMHGLVRREPLPPAGDLEEAAWR